ncbi:8-amino-7-oxononanoate synthase [Paraferrimonas sp. SM1919]|uniref:8-amino-7-oxononanoate synthase n=1 Tax=Paraferrimonas sp. SM1919 TaxID=2662263 RepID=UPI0013D1324C|nr:8-amino-7-oxononanoate synthase [Paraferrimonas sp. SM1919]
MWQAKLDAQLSAQQSKQLLRSRVGINNQASMGIVRAGKSVINFASNDYLGLAARSPTSFSGWVGSGASPLVSGYTIEQQRLEQSLCELLGFESALLFCSGFSANYALLKTLSVNFEQVVADKLIHASMVDGIVASGAKLRRFGHNDHKRAEALMAKAQASLLVTESVFSMDGDIAPMTQLQALCNSDSAMLIDDAHGFGVIGQHGLGACEYAKPDILVITFGKAMGCQGAAVLASKSVTDYMQNFARHYVYSTALSPVMCNIALDAVEQIKAGEQKQKLDSNLDYFNQQARHYGVNAVAQTPIVPVNMASNDSLLATQQSLLDAGFFVGAMRTPTVASPRLRLTITSEHSKLQIQGLCQALADDVSKEQEG